jgi:hypothetical protein
MSDSETGIIISCRLVDEDGKKQNKKRKRKWVQNICKKRTDFEGGGYHALFQNSIEDYVKMFQYFRMTHDKCSVVLDWLKPDRSSDNRPSFVSGKLHYRDS